MDTILPPRKRRKARRDQPLMEGSTGAADAVTVEHVEVKTRKGIVVRPVQVPLLPERQKTETTNREERIYVEEGNSIQGMAVDGDDTWPPNGNMVGDFCSKSFHH